ncbi:hypothetical protein DL93DRAFT_2071275 [Clavulina sp. PMI_390]|nr:hypothetical protein DL93DRAFT_2071275 [Clavulina sp. PMI_390]
MDLDLEESSVIPYEPDSIANSIMNPPSPPPLFGATVFSDSVDATLTKHVTTVPDGPGHSSTPHASTSERSPSPPIPIPLPILSHPQSSKFFSGASASTSGSGKPGTSRRVIEQDEETMTASGSSSDGEPPERWSMNSKLAQRREAGREAERGTSKSAAATSATGPKASPELRSQYSLPRTEAAQNRAPVPKQPLPTPVVVSDDGDSDFEIIEAPSKPTTPKTLTEYFSPKSSKSSPIVEVVIPVINRTKPTARLPLQPSSPSKRKNATGPRHHADQFSELMPGQPTNPSTSASAGPSSSRNSAPVPFDGVSLVSGRVIRASDASGSSSTSTNDAAGTSEGRANRLR